MSNALNQAGANRLMFPNQQQQQQQQAPGSQTGVQSVGLPGPSPTTVANPGLSPFGQPLSQNSNSASATVNNTQFATTSNGPTSLPSTSPASNQSQFNDVMKNR